jgi:methylmalonyl-CoA/ethylmalonyl-CoA epimerase
VKILKVNHLGIVPKDPQQTHRFFDEVLKLAPEGSEAVPDQKVFVDFFAAGGTRLEILTPTSDDSPVAQYLAKRGSGIQHVALEVDDLASWLGHLKAHGVEMIDAEPRRGAHNTQIAFIHPRATGGVLVELVQEGKPL